jgi:hypothetical protein
MNLSDLFDESITLYLGIALIVLGFGVSWHGLRGGPKRKLGLLRSRAGSIHRIEGWRRLIVGLVLIGLGIASAKESRFFFFLSVAFGFVEYLESSAVLAVMKRDPRRIHANAARLPGH